MSSLFRLLLRCNLSFNTPKNNTTVRRLATANKFEVLEEQNNYPNISKEGFVARIIIPYGRAGMFENAQKVFEEMPQRNCKSRLIHLKFSKVVGLGYCSSLLPEKSSKVNSSNVIPVRRYSSSSRCLETMSSSVVKIFYNSTEEIMFRPWMIRKVLYCGSGFAIAGKRILTNAHVVNSNACLYVRRPGSTIKYRAHVTKTAHECDLAVLEVNSPDFWQGLIPLELGKLPSRKKTVTVIGYPQGSENLCFTAGVVTNVVVEYYAYSRSRLLVIEIKANIIEGHSGGPAISSGKVIGVVFQGYTMGQVNYGHVIPTPVIHRFLSFREESAKCSIFGSLGCGYVPVGHLNLKNFLIRNIFEMVSTKTGVVVITKAESQSGAHGILEPLDVIVELDGSLIDKHGIVYFRKGERIHFIHLISMKKPGESVLLKVLRFREEHEFMITLKPVKPNHKVCQYYTRPSFISECLGIEQLVNGFVLAVVFYLCMCVFLILLSFLKLFN